jgi:hypothetical protein
LIPRSTHIHAGRPKKLTFSVTGPMVGPMDLSKTGEEASVS